MARSKKSNTVNPTFIGYSTKAIPPPPTKTQQARDFMPIRRICPKCDDEKNPYNSFKEYLPSDKFCSHCGTELETQIADVYLTVSRSYYSPEQFDYHPEEAGEPERTDHDDSKPVRPGVKRQRDDRNVISLKQLIVLIREYEKEMVLEGI